MAMPKINLNAFRSNRNIIVPHTVLNNLDRRFDLNLGLAKSSSRLILNGLMKLNPSKLEVLNKASDITKINEILSKVRLSVVKVGPAYRIHQIEKSGFMDLLTWPLPMPVLAASEGLVIEHKPQIDGISSNVSRIAVKGSSADVPLTLQDMKEILANLKGKHDLKGKPDLKEALAYALKVETKFPDDIWNVFTIAMLSLDTHDREKACEYFRKYTKMRPDDAVGWVRLGGVLFDQGNLEEGLKYLEKAVQMDPSQNIYAQAKYQLLSKMDISKVKYSPYLTGEWYFAKAMAMEENGDLKMALFFSEQATIINPKIDDRVWEFRLNILRKQKDLAGELNLLDKWLIAKPNNLIALFDKAVVLVKMNDDDSAIACLRAVNKIEPREVNTLHYLGLLLIYKGSIKEGLEFLLRAKTEAPNDFSSMQNSVAVLKRLAPAQLDAYPLLKSEVLFDEAVALYKNGKFEDAAFVIAQATNLDPKNANAWQCFGVIMDAIGHKMDAMGYKPEAIQYCREAIKDFNISLELDPVNPWALYNKGLTLEGLGEIGEAIICYERAKEIYPDFSEVIARLNDLKSRNY